MELGFLSSEEHRPRELVEKAPLADRDGTESVWLLDHFHPSLDQRGVLWSVMGATVATARLRVIKVASTPGRG